MGDDDAELETRIRTAPAVARDALAAAITDLRRELDVRPTIAWSAVPGHFPYPQYPDVIRRVLDALQAVGAGPTFDWIHWSGAHMTAAELQSASLADVARTVTVFRRGERFVDGLIAGAVEDGRLLVVADRVLAALRPD